MINTRFNLQIQILGMKGQVTLVFTKASSKQVVNLLILGDPNGISLGAVLDRLLVNSHKHRFAPSKVIYI
jgi:hypothetical protein